MGSPALACSRLAMVAKLAPYDTSVSQKLDVAVRCLLTLFACLPHLLTRRHPQFDMLTAAQIAQLAVRMHATTLRTYLVANDPCRRRT